MARNRPNPGNFEREASAPARKDKSRRNGQLNVFVRIAISLVLLWHVTAVFLAPLSVPPSSRLILNVAQQRPMQWYLDALYLNHGYHFFAPEPSTGHLIRYTVYDERGGEIAKGEFPNLKDQWPRLRYHRYFMLADQCELPIPQEAERKQWQRTYLTAYARELLREHNGASVRVQRVIHFPAFVDDVRNGMQLNDPRTYKTELEVTQRRQDLNLPPANATSPTGAYNMMRRDVASGWQGGAR